MLPDSSVSRALRAEPQAGQQSGAGVVADLATGRTAGVGHLEHPRVAGLLLAAGQGSRLGRPKALVELGGLTLAERGVAILRDGGTDPVIMVTGAAPVSLPGVIAAHNPDWRSGMGSSLREGLQTLPQDRDAVVVALVDQPLIGAAAVRRLVSAFLAGARIAVATYQGKPRNPVLIARPYWAEIAATARGDVGARTFLREHPALVTQVECGDVGRPDDLDTPQDLARIAALLAPPGSPVASAPAGPAPAGPAASGPAAAGPAASGSAGAPSP